MAPNVYFQTPENTLMKYPCIRYERDQEDKKYASNKSYSRTKRYQLTIIDEDPDSVIPDKVGDLPMCTFQRFYAQDQLNHTVYSLYY